MDSNICGDPKGIVFIEFVQERHMINGKCYANLLKKLRKATKYKRTKKLMYVYALASSVQCSGTQILGLSLSQLKENTSLDQYRCDDYVKSALDFCY